jgi:hypothetical protein
LSRIAGIARAEARTIPGAAPGAAKPQEERKWPRKNGAATGKYEAQGREVGSDRAGLAVRQEGSIGCDDPDEAKLRPAVTTRSRETTATFSRAFVLSDVDRPLPAGTYRIVVDEEDIPGLSFLAFRRTATMLYLPALSAPGGVNEVFLVNPDELAAALEADRVAT